MVLCIGFESFKTFKTTFFNYILVNLLDTLVDSMLAIRVSEIGEAFFFLQPFLYANKKLFVSIKTLLPSKITF